MWSHENFQSRIEARAAELGKTVAQIEEQAGLSPSSLRKKDLKRGNSVDVIFRVADPLQWHPVEVMGYDLIDRDSLRIALDVAGQTLPRRPPTTPDWLDKMVDDVARNYRFAMRLKDKRPTLSAEETREILLTLRMVDSD